MSTQASDVPELKKDLKKPGKKRLSKLEHELERLSGFVTLEEKILRGNYKAVVSAD